jgi:hypothetical protein
MERMDTLLGITRSDPLYLEPNLDQLVVANPNFLFGRLDMD